MRTTARLLTGAAVAAASLGLATVSATGAFAGDSGDFGGGDPTSGEIAGAETGGADTGGGDPGGGEIGGPVGGDSFGGGAEVGGQDVGGPDVGGPDVGGPDVGGDSFGGGQDVGGEKHGGGDKYGGGDHGGDEHGVLELTPSTAVPGAKVTVNTTACGTGGYAKGDASDVGAGEFELKSETHKEVVVGQFMVPDSAKPGTYGIVAKCKNGKEADGDLTVQGHSGPIGHVKTGVGGSVGPDTTQIAAGVAVLAATAAGGTLLLRRRASGTQSS